MRITLENTDQNNHQSRLSQAKLTEIYRNMFTSSPEGEYILDDLANKACMFTITTDKDDLQYREGMRAIYLYIISQITNSKNELVEENKIEDDYKRII